MKAKIISVIVICLVSMSITACGNSSSNNSSSNNSSVHTSVTAKPSSNAGNAANTTSANTNNAVNTTSANGGNAANTTNVRNVANTTNATASVTKVATTNNKTVTKVTPTVSSAKSANNIVMSTYNEVLQNKIQFFSTDSKKTEYLNDFLTDKAIYDTTFKITHFAVLDMDGDNVTEVVLELSIGGEPQFYEVLHYMNGKVYGYLQVLRGLENLKVDGTFVGSSGALYNDWGKLKFTSSGDTMNIFASEQPASGNPNSQIQYTINNEKVTKQVFDEYINKQNAKSNAIWYVFNSAEVNTIVK